ncbi:MAG: amidohydrolase family protein [Bacteroidia bacterium]|nr:amidohydrolase family protein [Bacteroidia bacterium]
MTFHQAAILFPITSPPIKNGIVVVDDSGVIIEIIDPSTYGELPSGIIKHEGFLCPGFVNMHCHLELSHLKGKFPEKTGLVGFIDQMRLNRGGEQIHEAIANADREMNENGIVAVGDISNSNDSIDVKKESKIFYHTFVEMFDVAPGRAEKVLNDAKQLAKQFSESGLSNSLAPHAPYTVSAALLSLLSKEYFNSAQLSTIHNQETEDEDKMFHSQNGGVYDFLVGLNPAVKEHNHENNSSLEYILDHLHHFEKLLLVHNTFTKEEHIIEAHDFSDDLYWCFCPNANMYIENRLPDVEIFRKNNCKITIGTDSYASNRSLSIVDELKTISNHYSEISLHEMLNWACINGAAFLGKEDVLGSFDKGKRPGIVLIENVDVPRMKLTDRSTSKRIK